MTNANRSTALNSSTAERMRVQMLAQMDRGLTLGAAGLAVAKWWAGQVDGERRAVVVQVAALVTADLAEQAAANMAA